MRCVCCGDGLRFIPQTVIPPHGRVLVFFTPCVSYLLSPDLFTPLRAPLHFFFCLCLFTPAFHPCAFFCFSTPTAMPFLTHNPVRWLTFDVLLAGGRRVHFTTRLFRLCDATTRTTSSQRRRQGEVVKFTTWGGGILSAASTVLQTWPLGST